jgi:CheY-like chemotaxis protein
MSALGQAMINTILVVEDELLVRMAISGHLEGCGYNVLEAEDADEAMALLGSHSQIDLVFTDVRMPGSMDGLGLAKWITQYRPEIAVLVASGDSAKEKAVGELRGAQAFSKPYNFERITDAIGEAINARRSDLPN